MQIDRFKYCKMRLREMANKILLHMVRLNRFRQVMAILYIYLYIVAELYNPLNFSTISTFLLIMYQLPILDDKKYIL